MVERTLGLEEASSAKRIQQAINDMARTGGRLILPAMELALDRGLRLRSNVELIGQGQATVLRKGPGRVYPLSGYHNYGMRDIPLCSTAGLETGMTVSIHDNRTHGGFYETFATITWIEGDWVGLDHGIEADYHADEAPCMTTVYPLIFGHRIERAAVRDLRLEGNRTENEKTMGGCRGGALYFYQSRNIKITGVQETDYHGEGLSFQMCRDMVIRNSRFDGNTGNGLHPGAGSTGALFEYCAGEGNKRSGFFFCVRANHITVRDCSFRGNTSGMSIGTRDNHNRIDACTIQDNRGPGILIRRTPSPTEVRSCLIQECVIAGNAFEEGQGQVVIENDARDLAFVNNRIAGNSRRPTAGVFAEAQTRRLYLEGNTFEQLHPDISAAAECLTDTQPIIECGCEEIPEVAYRHLG